MHVNMTLPRHSAMAYQSRWPASDRISAICLFWITTAVTYHALSFSSLNIHGIRMLETGLRLDQRIRGVPMAYNIYYRPAMPSQIWVTDTLI
jgi:hypothetical protein